MHNYGLKLSMPNAFKAYHLPDRYKTRLIPDINLIPAFAMAGITHKDQGKYGSCVFCSGTVAASYISYREHGVLVDFSAFYSYYKVRSQYLAAKEIRSIDTDCGAYGSDFMASAKADGLCSEVLWPSNADHFAKEPTAEAVHRAMQSQALETLGLPLNTDVLAAVLLIERVPIQIGIDVPEELEGDSVARTGRLLSLPEKYKSLGKHEVLLVGTVTINGVRHFWIWNSWGNDWGQGGNVLVSEDVLSTLLCEARIMLKIE